MREIHSNKICIREYSKQDKVILSIKLIFLANKAIKSILIITVCYFGKCFVKILNLKDQFPIQTKSLIQMNLSVLIVNILMQILLIFFQSSFRKMILVL